MRSLSFLLTRRWILFFLTVVLLSLLAWRLGVWQFHRLDDRKDSNSIVERNEHEEPAPVEQVMSTGTGVDTEHEWRRVVATGEYDVDDTVIVRYRTRDGSPGVDVVVPLVTRSGTALLVDRGWMATQNSGDTPDDIPAPPPGEVTVEGWVRKDATGDSTRVDDHSTRAISSTEISAALDLEAYRGFVDLVSEDPAPAEGLELASKPELDNGPHFFYGLQWWFFGLLAVIGFFWMAYDEWSGKGSKRARKAPVNRKQQPREEARRR
ncbi:SURF1 family protein [Nocardioides sp. JQ2195]|uniref:SURF1 family cytochrome oxidase biogenesis protein n=1 Tax=Nocardioides sp. JQ2195 TaxID=2592334 RepID=UPI00143E8770|nr:SURF1 family protein [Nocardioides sp. JQ2195]QIX26774.1 SURF1 family protein [Nocardioides sp. JQ2195]